MIRFAREYGPRPIVQQPAAQLATPIKRQPPVAQIRDPEKRPQAAAQLGGLAILPELEAKLAGSEDRLILQQLAAKLPWTYNVIMIQKVKGFRARFWYMQRTCVAFARTDQNETGRKRT